MEWFEVWIWSSPKLQTTHQIIKLCFPEHHKKFTVIVRQGACQKTNILLGYQFVYHKKLYVVWRLFHDLDGINTLISYEAFHNVMWNIQGTYLIFPKMWKQSAEDHEIFLGRTIIPRLLGWIYARNKQDYTWKTLVNEAKCDRETLYVLEQYMKKIKL